MRLQLSDKRPCRLERGEIRRVPQSREAHLVGYHVCCPRCGFITIALQGQDGFAITETGAGGDVRLSFSRPLRCTYCAVLICVEAGHAALREDDRVRAVRYR